MIVPTLGEPLDLLERTVRSVLEQDWPNEQLWILVSDDAHDARVRELVQSLALAYPRASLRYHRPPRVGDKRRRGDAKAGNLNSALTRLPKRIEYVETRDADDLVGDRRFLRETVGQLQAHERLAFVQTAKAGAVSQHDPFDNQQPHFFQCALPSRYAANAVFPCGSGVVWRRRALHEIGDFPTWNLVEDLQSGLEALRRGWEGCYLPILGAFAQHSPEDLPNFIKQRGTWALDTVRLTLWADKRGLRMRQRLQFYELGLFYMQGPATLVFLLAPVFGFMFHVYPVVTTTSSFIVHFWPFAVALELYLALVHRPMSFEQLWRARLVWAGLCFVYARACFLAVSRWARRQAALPRDTKGKRLRLALAADRSPCGSAGSPGGLHGLFARHPRPAQQLRCGLGLLGRPLRFAPARFRPAQLAWAGPEARRERRKAGSCNNATARLESSPRPAAGRWARDPVTPRCKDARPPDR